jgi:protein O-GlcNAc transferase
MPLAPLPPSPTPFQRAIEHHRNGRLREAEALYREVLAATPRHADALHLLGVIALQSGHAEAAIELIGRAVEVRPVDNYFCNLGNAFKAQGPAP